jgi:hypothetical protein
MIAIPAVGYYEVKPLIHLRLAILAQLLDLLNTHSHLCLVAGDSPD